MLILNLCLQNATMNTFFQHFIHLLIIINAMVQIFKIFLFNNLKTCGKQAEFYLSF